MKCFEIQNLNVVAKINKNKRYRILTRLVTLQSGGSGRNLVILFRQQFSPLSWWTQAAYANSEYTNGSRTGRQRGGRNHFDHGFVKDDGQGHPPYDIGQLGWCWGDVEMMATDLWLMATSSSYNKDKIFKLPTSWGNTLLLSGINVSNAIIRSIKTRITILCYWKTMKECFRILKYCQFCLCFCNLLSWWIRNAKVFERIKENLSVVQQTKKCLETCWGRNSTDQKTRM